MITQSGDVQNVPLYVRCTSGKIRMYLSCVHIQLDRMHISERMHT